MSVTMKIKLSPTKAGELYTKWSNLVEEVKTLKEENKKLKSMLSEDPERGDPNAG